MYTHIRVPILPWNQTCTTLIAAKDTTFYPYKIAMPTVTLLTIIPIQPVFRIYFLPTYSMHINASREATKPMTMDTYRTKLTPVYHVKISIITLK